MKRVLKATGVFSSNTNGSAVPLFAFGIMMTLVCAGMAIDFARTTHARSALASAADAAALASGKALLDGRMTEAEVKTLAGATFEANASNVFTHGKLTSLEVNVDRKAGTAEIVAELEVETTLMRLAGLNSVRVPIRSVTQFDQTELELAMVLDVTGSMGGSKIADLRTAATDAVDILMPAGGSAKKTRIALAPYATSVNAGSYATTVTDGASKKCVHERGGAQKFTDAYPGPGTWLGFTKKLSCPDAEVQALTTDSSILKTKISSYKANGMTAGHIGTAWGWYLLSPDWSSVWPKESAPAPHDPTKTLKAVILMTDGEFNTQYVSANGSSSSQTSELCKNMKADGIIVYAVAFMAPTSAQKLLQGCASSNAHYFSTSSGSALRSAFQQIAKNLGQLRITH